VGVGRYAGVPDSYRHLHDVAPVDEETVASIPAVADGEGGRETLYEAMQCSVGSGRCPSAGCADSGRRCPGFRETSLPILVTLTDEGDQCSFGPRFPECGADHVSVGEAARDLGAVLVGIDAAAPPDDATDFLRAAAEEAGSVDGEGEPLVFSGSEADVVNAVRRGLVAATTSPLPIRVELAGEDLRPDAVIGSVRLDLESEGCFPYRDAEDTDRDGFPDRVQAAGPGTTACFVIEPRESAALEGPAEHRLTATLLAGGGVVDTIDVCVVVE
jgi:hypothetical protein